MRGRTRWGTNGNLIRHAIAVKCGGGEHQQVIGSNKFGMRSIQKATWPNEMCAKILKAIIEELEHRSCYLAFPAEIVQEEAEELCTLDRIEGDQQQTIGTTLGDKAEEEQELLDSLTLDGFPIQEEARRKAWMSLPRPVRASIRRLHTMIGQAQSSHDTNHEGCPD